MSILDIIYFKTNSYKKIYIVPSELLPPFQKEHQFHSVALNQNHFCLSNLYNQQIQ